MIVLIACINLLNLCWRINCLCLKNMEPLICIGWLVGSQCQRGQTVRSMCSMYWLLKRILLKIGLTHMSSWYRGWGIFFSWLFVVNSIWQYNTANRHVVIFVFSAHAKYLSYSFSQNLWVSHLKWIKKMHIYIKNDLRQRMAKPTKWHLHPAKTQISLGIRPVLSVFAVRMNKAWALSYPSDWMSRLIWVFTGRTCHFGVFFFFCMPGSCLY